MNNSQKWIYILLICLLAVAICNAQTDTAKQKQPDSVRITLSLKEFQSYMQQLMSAANLSREAKKPSEIATITVFTLQVYEAFMDKGKAMYNKEGKWKSPTWY